MSQKNSLPGGYLGRILVVHLDTGKIEEETPPGSLYESHISGLGLAGRLLYDRIPAGADPLGPENVLAFVPGLLTGTGSLFTGRWTVAGKSPLTGGWGDANCGGNFSPAIKQCGYDGIFFHGRSDHPVYLSVQDGKAELRDARDLWGKDTAETEELLAGSGKGKKPVIAAIGPAGEKRSLISGIANDGGRMAARSGLGAVMGAKNLKAVVLSGKSRIPVFDRDAVRKLSKACNRWVQLQPPLFPGSIMALVGTLFRLLPGQMAQDGLLYKSLLMKWGTVSMNQASVEMGDTPVKNWAGNSRDYPLSSSRWIDPDLFRRTEIRKYHCYSCPLGCGAVCSLTGTFNRTHRPEYETVAAFGPLCLNTDTDSIFYINELLNRAGMDTISAGATVAFAMECYEKGLLRKSDLDGIDLAWGNADGIIALLYRMIRREGIGDVLADGVRKAAERIGGGAGELAMHAGGQELPMHDGRNDPGFALHYAADPAPGRHTVGSYLYYEMFQLWRKLPALPRPAKVYPKNLKYAAEEEKAVMAAACARLMNVANSAGMCLFGLFLGVHRVPLFEWLNAATGWEKTAADYMETGGEIQTVKQLFNIRQGIDPRSVTAPSRTLGRPPQKKGANRNREVDEKTLKREYWKAFGWNPETGIPEKKPL